MEACNENIQKALDISLKMLALAEKGSAETSDVGCLILYATLLDTAYRIKNLADKERSAHIKNGKWNDSGGLT